MSAFNFGSHLSDVMGGRTWLSLSTLSQHSSISSVSGYRCYHYLPISDEKSINPGHCSTTALRRFDILIIIFPASSQTTPCCCCCSITARFYHETIGDCFFFILLFWEVLSVLYNWCLKLPLLPGSYPSSYPSWPLASSLVLSLSHNLPKSSPHIPF